MYVLSRNIKNIRTFYLKIFIFGGKIFSEYLNWRVFVMARRWFHMWCLFPHCLFLISPSFGASGGKAVLRDCDISKVSSLLFFFFFF